MTGGDKTQGELVDILQTLKTLNQKATRLLQSPDVNKETMQDLQELNAEYQRVLEVALSRGDHEDGELIVRRKVSDDGIINYLPYKLIMTSYRVLYGRALDNRVVLVGDVGDDVGEIGPDENRLGIFGNLISNLINLNLIKNRLNRFDRFGKSICDFATNSTIVVDRIGYFSSIGDKVSTTGVLWDCHVCVSNLSGEHSKISSELDGNTTALVGEISGKEAGASKDNNAYMWIGKISGKNAYGAFNNLGRIIVKEITGKNARAADRNKSISRNYIVGEVVVVGGITGYNSSAVGLNHGKVFASLTSLGDNAHVVRLNKEFEYSNFWGIAYVAGNGNRIQLKDEIAGVYIIGENVSLNPKSYEKGAILIIHNDEVSANINVLNRMVDADVNVYTTNAPIDVYKSLIPGKMENCYTQIKELEREGIITKYQKLGPLDLAI